MASDGLITFIVGPTAAGKSEYSYALAKKNSAVIISCDSMLVYKEPEILTNKPAQVMLEQVRHEFIDIISVTQEYDVNRYCEEARKKIFQYHQENVPVIICGGTGMYMKALLDGIFKDGAKDDTMRISLEQKDANTLYSELKNVDPVAAEKISINDKRRLVRALEVYHVSGVPISVRQKDVSGIWGKYDIKIIGLTVERTMLYARINARTDEMFKRGAVDEAKKLLSMPLSKTAGKIIGLNEIKAYLSGQIDLEECKDTMKQNTRNYAKRQMTWFNKDKRIEWVVVKSK
jgi:tRNA dimethylallyltransferase